MHIIFLLFLFILLPATTVPKSVLPDMPELGLPTIAWPAPLFSFGQDILYANTLSPETYTYYTDGPNNNFLEMNYKLIYGITNRWIVSAFPTFFQVIEDGQKDVGMGDFALGTEYAFYQDVGKDHVAQLTFVAQLELPSGNPAVSRATTSVFLGATASTLSDKWYNFASVGIQCSAKRNGITYGHIVLYELGVGRTIFHREDSYFAHLLVEFNGSFTQHVGPTNTSSLGHVAGPGGNIIFAGPSLLVGGEQWILYIGFQYPIAQQIFSPTGGFTSSFTMGYGLDIYIQF